MGIYACPADQAESELLTALTSSAEHIAVLRWHVERLLESGMASPGAQTESLSRALQWLDTLRACAITEDD